MAIKLEDAVAVVQKEIRKWREKYESVANENRHAFRSQSASLYPKFQVTSRHQIL